MKLKPHAYSWLFHKFIILIYWVDFLGGFKLLATCCFKHHQPFGNIDKPFGISDLMDDMDAADSNCHPSTIGTRRNATLPRLVPVLQSGPLRRTFGELPTRAKTWWIPLVIFYIAIENGDFVRWFTMIYPLIAWWCSLIFHSLLYVYQRVDTIKPTKKQT